MSRLIGYARCLKSPARVSTPSVSDAGFLMLSGFGCAVGSMNCSRKVAVLRAAAASCR